MLTVLLPQKGVLFILWMLITTTTTHNNKETAIYVAVTALVFTTTTTRTNNLSPLRRQRRGAEIGMRKTRQMWEAASRTETEMNGINDSDDGFNNTSLLHRPPLSRESALPCRSRREFVSAASSFLLATAVLVTTTTDDGASAAQAAISLSPKTTDNIQLPSLTSFKIIPQFDTVDDVPKEYFQQNKYIYAFVERIIDGDTIRVRHLPAYRFRLLGNPQPLQQRGIAQDTLSIRIYGVDTPELAKKGQPSQPYAEEAKHFTSSLVYHRVVKITFLRKDQYRRAVCSVQTLGSGFLCSWIPFLGPKDLSVELASAGLAELYTGGGAEYNVCVYCVLRCFGGLNM